MARRPTGIGLTSSPLRPFAKPIVPTTQLPDAPASVGGAASGTTSAEFRQRALQILAATGSRQRDKIAQKLYVKGWLTEADLPKRPKGIGIGGAYNDVNLERYYPEYGRAMQEWRDQTRRYGIDSYGRLPGDEGYKGTVSVAQYEASYYGGRPTIAPIKAGNNRK